VGFESAITIKNGVEICEASFLYDTSVPGNGTEGHLYGTDLGEQDKKALIEYLKTL
jgi:hypothetical protein